MAAPSACFLHKWVIGIAFGAGCEEGGLLRLIERGVLAKAFGQVGIREKRHTERDRVGLSRRQHLVGRGLGEFRIGNITAAESCLQLWHEAVLAQ